jgi:hypothetical protein
MDQEINRRSFLSKGAVMGGAALLGTAAAAGLAGCGGGSSSSSGTTSASGTVGVGTGTPVKGGTLTVAVTSEINGFYPATSNLDWTGRTYANSLYDLLVVVGSDGGYEPYLCQTITPNSTFDVWTMTLRPGVTFHDGSALTSAVVVSNVNALKGSLLTGKALQQVTSVAAPDAMTVTYTLAGPNPDFPLLLTTQVGYVVAQSMIDQAKSGTKTVTPVGTGPFVYSEWQPNDHLTVTRNPHYWRAGLPYLDKVVFRPVTDSVQRESALKTGSVDFIVSNDPGTVVRFSDNPSYQVVDSRNEVVGEPNMTFIALNTAVAPTNDLSIRQALTKATNQSVIQKVFGKGLQTPVNGPFLKGSPYYTDNGFPGYNLSAAKSLVSQYKANHGTPTVAIVTITDPRLAVLTQLLQQMWQEAGFVVTIQPVEQAVLASNLIAGKYQTITVTQFGAVTPDLNYNWWSTTTISPPGTLALNYTRNSDQDIESALLQGRATTDSATRNSAYQTVSKRLADDLPYIWLGQSIFSEVAESRVQNFNNLKTPDGKSVHSFLEGTFFPTEIWLQN